jgi:hypothetical protein
VLSVATTAISEHLDDDEIEGYVSLAIAGMYELSRGSASPWSAYLALLNNRRPQMASDLSESDREVMKKSEIYADIETDIVSANCGYWFSFVYFFFSACLSNNKE